MHLTPESLAAMYELVKTLAPYSKWGLPDSEDVEFNGTRFGCDCGTLADPYGPQFSDYLETNPTNWRSGFIVLTFHKGRLLWPEIVHVLEKGLVEFRGQVIEV